MYLCIVVFLLCLAVFDLFVGVSNDAVNFLQSAVGARVANYHTIVIIASIGVGLGAVMSSGMMDVARHGIMTPSQYSFSEVMTIFLAVMVTDVIILDVFNTLGMPTSTTVSLVFELLGGTFIVACIKMAGDDLTNDIVEYMRRQHNIRVSERMAERIKINVGSALSILEDAPEDFEVCGPNQMTALPMKVPVSYQEIAHCLDKSISKIEAAVLSALEQTPPELYADIVKNGIYLAGGGALLRGIDKRLRDKMGIEFHVADDPLHAVARGTGIALKNIDKFNFLIR